MSGEPNAAAAARLRQWLLHGPAQLRHGEHAGGVAGSLDAQGAAGYVYAEITGYWLHWLADLPGQDEVRAHSAAAAIDWATRQFAAAVPATRIYLGPAEPDWRNEAVFLFDLAMLAGGIARAVRAGLVPLPAALVARLGEELARLVVEGDLIPLRLLRDGAPLPDRWSTRLDRFELKAATRILMLADLASLPPALTRACARLVAARAPEAAQAPLELLHPTLYYLEGVLACDARHWPGVAPALRRVLALATAQGELPEAPDVPGVWRSDVIAQALRIGVLLRAHAVPDAPPRAALDALAAALARRVGGDGALAFRPDVQPPLPNVWCAMFAEQALRWHAAADATRFDPQALV